MERLRGYNPTEATYVTQFNQAIAIQEVLEKLDCQRLQLTIRRDGVMYSTIHEVNDLKYMAGQLAFRRWRDLRDLGLEDVATDIIYQQHLRRYM